MTLYEADVEAQVHVENLSANEVRWLRKQVRYKLGRRSTRPPLVLRGERITSSRAKYLRRLAETFVKNVD